MTLFTTLSDHAEASRQRHPLSHDELKKERVAERSRARAAATAAAAARGSVVVNHHHHQKQQQELVIHASSYENARA
jgi:hypothetical protein